MPTTWSLPRSGGASRWHASERELPSRHPFGLVVPAMNHGLDTAAIAVVAGCVILWSVVSARLERINITAPIAFVALGLIVTHEPVALIHVGLHSSAILGIAEITLALVLFADASRVNVHAVRADAALPGRLLGIGLPLTIGLGAAAAVIVAGGTLWLAAVIGAIVAPTDAALGASILQDDRVPARVRRVLNVESGLNDGIATPFVNLFLAAAVDEETTHSGGVGAAVVKIAVGVLIGGGAGLIGAVLLRYTKAHGWGAPAFQPLAVLGIALLAYAAAVEGGGNGFVAAFAGGLAFGSIMPKGQAATLGFTDDAGELLSLLVWFLFGATMIVPAFEHFIWQDAVFAVLALTAVRMAPVALALTGTGLDRATVSFIGWFGPRGLASVVFALIAVDSLDPADGDRVLAAVSLTVLLSVVAHGVTASPLAARYGALAARDPQRSEQAETPVLATRSLAGDRHRVSATARSGV
jgi:sodium/hydrogen antiporter